MGDDDALPLTLIYPHCPRCGFYALWLARPMNDDMREPADLVCARERRIENVKKRKREKQPSARDLFEECTRRLQELERRYESLFEFVSDPNTYAPHMLMREIASAVLDRDMKAGEIVQCAVPMKFKMR